jgi:hypothetical protein
MCQGKAKYRPMKGFEDAMHVIGEGNNPLYVCKKKEVPELFTPFYWRCYNLWVFFNNKIMPSQVKSWSELDEIEILLAMENHFKQNFDTSIIMLKYMESIIKHIRALGGVK